MIRTILQIDDDPDDCEMVKEALFCLEVTSYKSLNNPLMALSQLRDGSLQPDVILLDQNMHSMSGLELLEVLKKDRLLESIRVVMLSTSCSPKMIKLAKELGASECVMKPNSFTALKNLLKRLLN